VIETIIEVAKRAPSSMTTQPWCIHVLTGEPLERVRRHNMEEMIAGAKPKRDILTHGEYQGVHRQRQVDIAKKLFGAMGIARDDKPIRQDWVLRGFRQFDAPVSLVLTYDRALDPGAVCHFDLGALCYGIVLAAWDRGLSSVINGQGIMRSDIVREVANIPEERPRGISGAIAPVHHGVRPVRRVAQRQRSSRRRTIGRQSGLTGMTCERNQTFPLESRT
jgi:nitroreductase